MAIVLAGTTSQNPATLYPHLYSSCFWNFVTGWTCQTRDAPAPAPAPPTNGVSIMPLGGGGGTTLSLSAPPNAGIAMSGCCNCSKGSGSAIATPMSLATQAATVTAASPCGCADEKPEWLEILTAVVLVLLALAALQKQ